ncbi:MAG: hypothetical protein C5B49_12780 [Bdellovibrio sp.]|nr:MAG: hypothetical protein C5B49_12780 [Bdellovibrio sp.]
MSAIKRSILSLVPIPKSLDHLDIQNISLDELHASFVAAPPPTLRPSPCDVLIGQPRHFQDALFGDFWTGLRAANRGTQLILVATSNDPIPQLMDLHCRYSIFRVLERMEEADFEWSVFEAVEQAKLIQQNEQLQLLVNDQILRLKALNVELEERVVKRQHYLEESRRKSLIAQFRWSTLRQATERIHEAGSIAEMERQLTEVLRDTLNITQVRIVVPQQSSLPQAPVSDLAVHRVRLFQDENILLGYAIFLREASWPFSADEKDFLQKISEGISLAIRRLNQLELSRSLREQWQATFNAVSDPIALISPQYEVIQCNSAFAERARAHALGEKCYQLLFDRDQPCAHCQLGSGFRLTRAAAPRASELLTEPPRAAERLTETWDVHSQSLQVNPDEPVMYFNQYRNITEQMKMESQLIESAKLAELGIIGSSIAHELNNPLGGILSFVQMMKMDMKPTDPLYPDILEMEQGVLRCRDIVQNLLGFTRSNSMDERQTFDFRQAVQRALSLIDLQTRAHGIQVRRQIPDHPLMITGHLNLLSQALANLLQDSLLSVRQAFHRPEAHIEVIVIDYPDFIETQVLDNGLGAENSPRISIPLAQRIVLDHQGRFEVSTSRVGGGDPRSKVNKVLRLVKIILPKKI